MTNTIQDVIVDLEQFAPRQYQESYDNARLICGDAAQTCEGVLVCLDSTEEVIDEAIRLGCNLVIAHHPIVFSGLKSLTGSTYIERVIIKAIKADIAVYAIHTNLDNVVGGVNSKICEKLGLQNPQILNKKKGLLSKFVVYGLETDIEKIRIALAAIGAGKIGNYEECSYQMVGQGSYKPVGKASPTVGEIDRLERCEEHRLEVLVPNYLVSRAIAVAKQASSYEELALDVIPVDNANQDIGSGMIGELPEALTVAEFLSLVKHTFNCGVIRYTNMSKETIKKVAVCGGSGSFLLGNAIAAGADAFVTADYKYHQFFDAENRIMITDIGHYESEQFTIELLADRLKQNFSTFAVRLTSVITNPVNYY